MYSFVTSARVRSLRSCSSGLYSSAHGLMPDWRNCWKAAMTSARVAVETTCSSTTVGSSANAGAATADARTKARASLRFMMISSGQGSYRGGRAASGAPSVAAGAVLRRAKDRRASAGKYLPNGEVSRAGAMTRARMRLNPRRAPRVQVVGWADLLPDFFAAFACCERFLLLLFALFLLP